MNALFSRYGGCDATLEISHTVATIDARAKFAELRRIVRVMGEHDERWLNEANSHIDSLVEFLTDTLHAMDGMVEGDRFLDLQEEHEDATNALEAAQADQESAEEERDLAQAELDKIQSEAKMSPEALTSQLIEAREQIEIKDAQLAHMEKTVNRAQAKERAIVDAFRAAYRRAAKSKAAQEALKIAETEIMKAVTP